jgi:hypothetical protein
MIKDQTFICILVLQNREYELSSDELNIIDNESTAGDVR